MQVGSNRPLLWVLCLCLALRGCWSDSSEIEPQSSSNAMSELIRTLTSNIAEELTEYGHTDNPVNFYRTNFTSVATRVESMRNPCFVFRNKLQCYPAFFLTGVPKGGTTTMANVLMCHRNIMHGPKEPHIWTRFSRKFHRVELYGGYTRALLRQYYRDIMVYGDYSASTFWQWKASGVDQQFATVPAQVRHSLPDVPLVVMLRDPAKRAVSDFFYFRRGSLGRGDHAQQFHNEVVRSIAHVSQCFQEHSHSVDQNQMTLRLHNCLSSAPLRLHIGLYALSLALWWKLFPREQLLILRSEDFFSDPQSSAEQVLQHLSMPTQGFWERCGSRAYEKSASAPNISVNPETLQLLRDFYAPFNKVLAEMLEDDRFLW